MEYSAAAFKSPNAFLEMPVFNRRTVITFEKLERILYPLRDSEPMLARCEVCNAEVSWLSPNEVVAVSGLTLRELFRRIEGKEVHFTETASGVLRICLNSLH